MLLVLLIFTTIGVVYCQTNCPAYSAFPTYPNDNNAAQDLLNGTFTSVYNSPGVVDCQSVKYIIDASRKTTAYVEQPNCCLKMDDFVFNSNQIDYTIGPIPGDINWCVSLPSTTTGSAGSMKILTTTGTGDSLCLMLAMCQPDHSGISVMCRGIVPQLLQIVDILTKLLGPVGLADILLLHAVSPAGCALDNNGCPVD